MPAAYAHNRFADACMETLPEEVKTIASSHYDLFALGAHGPDVLFYHVRFFHPDEITDLGRRMHHEPGRRFFERVPEIYRAYPEKEEMLSYILGFLAHFALDSFCHRYINRKVRETEYSHNRIEAQYEAYLMRLDGKKPLRVNRSEVLHPARRSARVISRFFFLPEKKVLESIRGQKVIIRLLYSPHQVRKKIVRSVLEKAGRWQKAGDLFLDREIIPGCSLICDEIHEFQKKAKKAYPEMAQELMEYLEGRGSLGERFDMDFEGKKWDGDHPADFT